MSMCRLYSCLCCRRPSLLRTLLVLIVSLSVIFWVSLLGYQQRQTLLLSEQQLQQDASLSNSVVFDTSNKGKNTPRVLMEAYNGRVVNRVESADQKNNHSQVAKLNSDVQKKTVNDTNTGVDGAVRSKPVDNGNSSNSTNQRGVAISKHSSPLASDMVHLDSVPSQMGPDSLQLLHQRLRVLNNKQRVINVDKFPPLTNDGLVLIVQVHKRENYLKQLFESLKRAKGIDKVLLVISHDYFYDEMNAMVESVDFCRVSLSPVACLVAS